MAALDFDNSPNTESSVSTGDITWKLSKNASDGTPIWYATTDATQIIHVGVSAPPSPRLGQMWWCSATADEGGGRLYVYFDDVWVDASLPGGGGQGGDFLSKTEDDTAAGQITFQGLTTHEGGISVTGLTSAAGPDDSVYPRISSSDTSGGKNLSLIPRSADSTPSAFLNLQPPQASGQGGGIYIKQVKTLDGAQENVVRVASQWQGAFTSDATNVPATIGTYLNLNDQDSASTEISGVSVTPSLNNSDAKGIGFRALGKKSTDSGASSYVGFRSDVNNDSATEAYNFYANGNAPNLFQGETTCKKSLYCNSIPEHFLSTNHGFRVASQATSLDSSGLEVISRSSSNNGTKTALLFTKEDQTGTEATAVAGYLRINAGVGAASSITLTSADGAAPVVAVISDYRTKTLTPFTSTASAIVQQLQPGANGFIAHDLQALIPEAVYWTER